MTTMKHSRYIFSEPISRAEALRKQVASGDFTGPKRRSKKFDKDDFVPAKHKKKNKSSNFGKFMKKEKNK